MVDSPTTPHLLWSAQTTTRRAQATRARSVSASTRLGVVRPARSSMPWTPRKSVSTCRLRRAATATGPTSAFDGVRTPPVRMTVRSSPPRSCSSSATGGELVTTVRSGTATRCWATANVVVPAEIAIEAPGSTSAAAARAMADFDRVCRADLTRKPGSSALRPEIEVAPPCTRSTSPRRANASMSRRTVMSETPSALTSSETRAPPCRSTSSRIRSWRWRASTSNPLPDHHGAPCCHERRTVDRLVVPQVEAVRGHLHRVGRVVEDEQVRPAVAHAAHHLDAGRHLE